MNKTLIATLARAAALASLLIVGMTGAPLAQNKGSWTVVVATNAVVVHTTGTATLAVGEVVAPGDKIITEAGGAAVLARGDDLITMSEVSELTIASVQPIGGTMIEQPQGLVKYQVTKEPSPHFTVETEVLATIVKGTTFTVRATTDTSAVAVSEGKVEARDKRVPGAAAVYPGQVATVSVTGTPGVNVKAGTITDTAMVPGTKSIHDTAVNETPSDSTEAGGTVIDVGSPGATGTVGNVVNNTVGVVGDTVTNTTNTVSGAVNETTSTVGDTLTGLTGSIAGGSGSSGSGSSGSGSSGSGSSGSGSSGSGSSGSGSSGSGSSGSGGSGSSGTGGSGSGSSGSGSGGGLGGLGEKLGGGLGGLL
ncbi:MAG: FecR domain-containing protein [Rhodospirillaceae bacterium]|nr:FecR domain-containing protein [Rhodospirillaceae bacterium]